MVVRFLRRRRRRAAVLWGSARAGAAKKRRNVLRVTPSNLPVSGTSRDREEDHSPKRKTRPRDRVSFGRGCRPPKRPDTRRPPVRSLPRDGRLMVAGTRSLEARPQSRPAVVPLCRLNHPLDPRTPSRAMAGSPRHRPRSPSTGRGPGHGTPVGPAERRRNGRAFRGLRAGSPRRARAQQSARRARRQVACGLESESPTAGKHV